MKANESDNSEKIIKKLSILYDRQRVKYRAGPKSCGYATDLSFLHRLNIFKNWIDFSGVKNLKILDVGCGTGLMTQELVSQNEVWGIDISQGLLETAKTKRIKPVLGSAEFLPFQDDMFNMVVCMGVLPYYRNPENIISQIFRVTKPDGRIVITSTTGSWLIRSVKFLKNLSWDKSHLNRLYSAFDLEMCLNKQGINVVDTCLGYGDHIFSCKESSPSLRFLMLARVAAAFGTVPGKKEKIWTEKSFS